MVSTFVQPDYTANSNSTAYPLSIDAAIAAHHRMSGMFAPHEQATPDMTVRLDAGSVFNGATLSEVAAQNTGTITAPSVNPRIDRVVIDRATGAVSVIAGSESATPTAPAITAGKLPVCQIYLTVGQTEIVNADLTTDERNLWQLGLGDAATKNVGTASGTVAAGDHNHVMADIADLSLGEGSVVIDWATQTALSSLDITTASLFDGTYKWFEILISECIPVTDAVDFYLRIAEDGPTWKSGASDYEFAFNLYNSVATANGQNSAGAAQAILSGNTLSVGNQATEGWFGSIVVRNPVSTTNVKNVVVLGGYRTSEATATLVTQKGECTYKGSTSALAGVRLLFSSGNISTVTYKVVGH